MLLVVTEYGVIDRKYRAAAITENGIDALVRQHLNEHFRTVMLAPASG